MAHLTREQILKSSPATEVVPVPEWGDPDGTVLVAAMNGPRRFAYVHAQWDEHGTLRAEDRQDAVMAIFSIVDEDGALVFTVDDVEALWTKSTAAIDRVVKVAARLSGFNKAALEDAKKN